MTERAREDADGVRWTGRLAVAGLAIAAVTALVASLGLVLPDVVYWLGIVLSLGGVIGAAVYESRGSSVRYGAGVVSAVAGVLVVAYGIENGVLPATLLGVLVVGVGAAAAIVATRRTE